MRRRSSFSHFLSRLRTNMLDSRYSMASTSDLTHQQPVDSSTVDSSGYMTPRQRHDSNTLPMLPAPLAVNSRASSSVGVSRSSEDNYASDTGYSPNTRLPHTPQTPDGYAESNESGQRLLGSPFEQIGRSTPPRTQNISPFDNNGSSPTDQIDVPRAGRGVQLSDTGPVPSDGVRRVSRSQGRPASLQNRYSRNSGVFNLPPGAAPPQPNGGVV
jgi:chitin synthase